MQEWTTDILGPPFEQRTLQLGLEENGALVATLVRAMPPLLHRVSRPLSDADVLYVHGWSDYFFQTELAQFFTGLGARFYALDLRRYGRSMRPGQAPGYITNLSDYSVEIEAALAVMGHADGGPRRLILMGHSTGGLSLTMWAAAHPGRADALILNSPWLEFQASRYGRQALAPLVGLGARLDPRAEFPVVDFGFYTRAQRDVGSLPVPEYREDWRPATGFPTRPGWLAAILDGHRRVAHGVDVGCPTLVILSKRSSMPFEWTDAMRASDSVLVVDDIAVAATKIGADVTIARIDGALHDVFRSAPEPTAAAYSAVSRWVHGRRR